MWHCPCIWNNLRPKDKVGNIEILLWEDRPSYFGNKVREHDRKIVQAFFWILFQEWHFPLLKRKHTDLSTTSSSIDSIKSNALHVSHIIILISTNLIVIIVHINTLMILVFMLGIKTTQASVFY